MTQSNFSSVRYVSNMPLLTVYDPNNFPPLKERDMDKLLQVYRIGVHMLKEHPVQTSTNLRLYLVLPNDQTVVMTHEGQRVEDREWETISTDIYNMRKRRWRLMKHVAGMILCGHTEPYYSADVLEAMRVVALGLPLWQILTRVG